MHKLLLWDIDGTLTHGDGAGERSHVIAMKQVFDVDASLDEIDHSGRTDRIIADLILDYYKIEGSEQNIHDYLEAYLNNLPLELPKGDGFTHPGILDIIEEARNREDVHQGLLTGNLRRGAEIKLNHFNIWHYFGFGAFASDNKIRNELGPIALQRAREKTGHEFSPEHIFVIGDTPHDIECGKVIGAHTIAVATGSHTAEQLSEHNPTALFENLADTQAFFAIVD